jgi:hypothetical protein
MNYIKAKTEAQIKANASQQDYVITYNGVNYNTSLASKFRGEYFEKVTPEQIEIEIVKKAKIKPYAKPTQESEVL